MEEGEVGSNSVVAPDSERSRLEQVGVKLKKAVEVQGGVGVGEGSVWRGWGRGEGSRCGRADAAGWRGGWLPVSPGCS